jgi:mono/diheme cytochrome c family protein
MHRPYLIAGALVVLSGAALAQQTAPHSTAPATAQAAPAPSVQARGGNVEHGRYLVHDVAMCPQCHSPRDDQGNLIESRLFDGGPIPLSPPWPNNWALIAPRNKGLPGYDDAMAMRLLTEGAIGRDGKQLREPMPRFHMTRQDAADVIAYMRSLR